MHFSLRLLLPAALLSSSLYAHANNVLIGDFWLIHHHGEMNNNSLFIADGEASHIFARPGAIQSLGVYQLDEPTGSPLISYDVEVDCAKNRARISDAQSFDILNRWRKMKFSSQWESKSGTWLAQSRDFLCKPGERSALKMRSLGRMSAVDLRDEALNIFPYLGREQYKAALLKKIDEAFEKMPGKGARSSMENPQ